MAKAAAVVELAIAIIKIVDFSNQVTACMKAFTSDNTNAFNNLHNFLIRFPLITDAL